MNNKGHPTGPPPSYGAPPAAPPPSYAQAVGGVPPTSPYTPNPPLYSGGPQVVTTVVPVGTEPTHMICPFCHAEVDTTTRTEPGTLAIISSIVIAIMGCWLGCCLIPCCIDECMDIHHTCPNCKAYLGKYQR